MSSIKNVAGGSVPWENVRTPKWFKEGYKVTAAQAANHISEQPRLPAVGISSEPS